MSTWNQDRGTTSTSKTNTCRCERNIITCLQVRFTISNLDFPPSQSFEYNNRGRLSLATGIYGTLGCVYDDNGKSLSQTIDGVEKT